MIELFTIKKEIFRPVLSTITTLSKDVEFILYDNVQVCFFDSAKVCLCEATLKVEPAEKTTFKVCAFDWLSAVGTPKEDVVVSAAGNQVQLQWSKKPKVTKKFTTLADGNVKTVDFRVLEYTTTIKLLPDYTEHIIDLLKGLAAAKDSSRHLVIEKVGNLCYFKDNSTEPVVIEIDPEYVSGEDAKSMYPHDYVLGILNNYKLFNEIIFTFGADFPCKFTMENEDILFNILVAPRIDNED